MDVHASVSFKGERATAGRDRIRLLAAVGREGSISAAARAVGLSYKAAWDAIDGMNNLFGRALVEARSGGRRGGGARLTTSGIRVVETLGHLEGELTRVLRGLDPALAETGLSVSSLVSGFVMRTSARNALRGVIAEVRSDAVSAEIALAIGEETTIHATITRESVRELELCPGREAVALIKASFVSLGPADHAPRGSTSNRLNATLVRLTRGEANTECTLDIGMERSLVASVTTRTTRALNLKVGDRVRATFDARHVILAID